MSRSPHGERGLKFWCPIPLMLRWKGRSPHGERGLKLKDANLSEKGIGRSPHGERGLKFPLAGSRKASNGSLPPRGAWIEILSIW